MGDYCTEGKLRIGWSWSTPDGWLLHRTIKDNLWKSLETGNIDLKALISFLKIKEEWLEVRPGEKIPANYYLFTFIWKQYKKVYRKMKPSILYRLGIDRIVIFFIILFREDSAYCERIGGVVQYIIDNAEDWPKGDKEARLMALQDLKKWWMEEDWRTRGRDKLIMLVDWIIEQYEKDPFVRNSIDFWVDNILANKDKWNRGILPSTKLSYFDPLSWYPRGKGQVNYICHGRIS